jgi:pyrroline-5-carboxylate reductase
MTIDSTKVDQETMHPKSNQTLGLIGLGLMGTAMSERLLEHGFDVLVWNRTREKADPLLALGARWSDNPLADCDRVIISLYTSDIVKSVLKQQLDELSTKLTAEEVRGKILIDTTTGFRNRALQCVLTWHRWESSTWTHPSRVRVNRHGEAKRR